MARCIECSSFNPYYKGGWCNYRDCETSPSDSCGSSDYDGSHLEYDDEKVCSTCSSYSSSRGGWCDYYECRTNPNSYCSDYTYDFMNILGICQGYSHI